jgi:predicted enzyme related to lactoylglutathione lyase
MGRPVVHFEVSGKDAKKLQEFYAGIFEWHVDANNPMGYGIVDTHGGGINGGIAAAEGASQVTFYIEVDDPQAYLERIESAGGKTIVPVTEIPNMVTFAQFADPEGNIIGLVKEEQ